MDKFKDFLNDQDPAETRNLADEPACRAVRECLERDLARYWTREKALDEHARAKHHVSLLKQWTAATHPAPVEKWFGDPSLNYVETQSE